MTNNTKMRILAISLAVILSACGGAEERKAKYMEKGKNYFAEKNYEKARIEFKNVMQIDPKHADAYFYLGQVEEKNRDLQKAAGNYMRVLQLDPQYIDAKVKLAKIYTMVGTEDYIGQATKLLQEVFSSNPDHVEALLVDAVIDTKLGNKTTAIDKLKIVIEKSPKETDAYSVLSIIYASQDKDDLSIATLENGIQKNNDAVNLRMMLAQSLVKNNRNLVGAEDQLKKIIEISPDNYTYRVALATFYSNNNELVNAESVLRQAIADDEGDSKRYLVLIEYLAGKKSAKSAEDELRVYINKKPDMYELRFAQAKFYQELNQVDKAIEALAFVSDKRDYESDGIKAKVQLADIYLSKGDIKKSQKIINDVLADKPNDNSALLISGKLAFQKQDDLTVINALRSVIKDEPKNNEAALLLAHAHERSNETELAKEVLLRALEADPLNPKNHLNYANYLAGKNNMKLAIGTLDKALAYFKVDYDLMNGKLKYLAASKDDAAVKSMLDQLKNYFPDKEEVYMQRGQYFLSKKQYEHALPEYELALKNSRTVYKPLEAVVQMHMLLKQDKKAIELLQARLADNANDAIACQVLGQLYASRQDMNKAIEYFDKAMKNAKWDIPYISMASVYLAQKKHADALAILEKGVLETSNPAQIQLQLASLYEVQKSYDKAIAVYEKIIDVNPSSQLAANNLASLLLDVRGDEVSFKRAFELTASFTKTKHPALMDTHGWAALKNNDVAKAISVLEEVNRLAPDVGVFQYHLGMAYQQASDVANAKRYLSMATASKQEFMGKDKAKETLAKL